MIHFYCRESYTTSLSVFFKYLIDFSSDSILSVTMPRYYAKNDESLDLDNILEAIKQMKIHNASVRQAAIAHKISRATLGRYIAKFANIDVATANEDFMRNLLVESSKPGAKTVCFFI